jgi:hypothetical protein
MKTFISLAGMCACLLGSALHAQESPLESINAGGGYLNNAGVSVAYSFGQVFYEPTVFMYGSLTPGIQQPGERSLATDWSPQTSEPDIQVAPNPATDFLVVSFPSAYCDSPHSMSLLDLTGKNLYSEKISNETARLPLAAFAPGVYFLQIKNDNQVIKLFKILKK